jgi:aryl sulfotransferase
MTMSHCVYMGNSDRVRYRAFPTDSARWEGFVFRDGDIVISTPSKCATTWVQMICGLLIFQTTEFYRPLDVISPWLDVLFRPWNEVVADLEVQTHRRFIKTHTPLDGLPYAEQATYICADRDPRDVAMSWDVHIANANFETGLALRAVAVGLDDLAKLMPDGPPPVIEDERKRFWAWVDQPATPETHFFGLASTLHHLQTFWDVRDRPNLVLVRYEDLLADLEVQMRSLAERLAIQVADDVWPELVQAATFEQTSRRPSELVARSQARGAVLRHWPIFQ